MIDQKVNKWNVYWTPKILILSGIFLILFGKTINNHIIGSIIIISTGIVYFLFPLISGNIMNKNEILHICFGSLLGSLFIIASGIGLFGYFQILYGQFGTLSYISISIINWFLHFFELTLFIIFNNICSHTYFLILFIFCIFGTIMQKNEVNDVTQFLYFFILKENQKIKILHTRSNIESFIHTLFWVCFFSSILYSILWERMSTYRFLFEFFVGFLVVICPNAIDTTRTKFSRLNARIAGIMFVGGSGGFILMNYMNISIYFIIIFFISGFMWAFGIISIFLTYMGLNVKQLFQF